MKEVFFTNNIIYGFQKNGITVNGNAFLNWTGEPVTYSNIKAHIRGNEITGPGPIEVIAQNAIQFGWGATGDAKSNIISELAYTPTGWASTGILEYYGYHVFLQGNVITDCDPAVYIAAGNSTKLVNNTFKTLTFESYPFAWGLMLSGSDIKVMNNYFEKFEVGIYVGSSYYGATTNTKLINNTFVNVEESIVYSEDNPPVGVKEHATKEFSD